VLAVGLGLVSANKGYDKEEKPTNLFKGYAMLFPACSSDMAMRKYQDTHIYITLTLAKVTYTHNMPRRKYHANQNK
jgi:hypothetical protein